MTMAHCVNLLSHNSHISSVMSPEEVCIRSKSSYTSLHNDHPWVCPAYVLEPILRYDKKNPELMPTPRRAQYLGASYIHAITLGLFSKLQTVNISTQFYLVFDEYFETVHAVEDQEPPV